MRTRILSSDHGLAVSEAGPVCIAIWRGGVTRPRFSRQRAGIAEVVERHPERAAFLCVVEPTATPPDEEHRRASVQLLTSFGAALGCVAFVIEGSGHRAATTRDMASAMAALRASPEPPAASFLGVGTAVRWIGTHLVLASVDEVVAAVEETRAVMPPLIDTF